MAHTEVLVGRIGRAHGLRGEVTINPVTDSPEQRFAPGSQLYCQNPARTFTVAALRWQAGTLVVGFDEATDRNRERLAAAIGQVRLRRGGLGARRDRAGADSGTDGRSAASTGSDVPVHQP